MRRWCFGVALLAGCYRPATEAPCVVTCNFSAEAACPGEQVCMNDNLCHPAGGGACGDPGDAATIDGEVTDGPPVDEPPGSFCIGKGTGTGPGLIRVCRSAPPIAAVTLDGTHNTATFGPCEMHSQGPGLPPACVVWGVTIDLLSTGSFRVEGVHPLVLVGVNGITIDGMLDVSSHVDSMIAGAGADSSQCPPPTAPSVSGSTGAGGAAGGTGQGAGGMGGSSGGGNHGTPGIPTALGGVRGGCTGGPGISLSMDCKRGLGGGAVYLMSSTRIMIGTSGVINASGAGARGGDGSGCGAGSGGLIGFDAPQIVRNGKLFANGGGGSSGYNGGTSSNGSDPASPTEGGAGAGNITGGAGGGGAAGATFTGMPGTSVNAALYGGGGGGGIGWIVTYGGGTIAPGAEVSPPPNAP